MTKQCLTGYGFYWVNCAFLAMQYAGSRMLGISKNKACVDSALRDRDMPIQSSWIA